MKRITVAVTFVEGYTSSYDLKKVRVAMVNAGVLKASELGLEIALLEGKTGNVRRRA